ncbi:thymidine kinase [Klebsiella phage vB_KvM-Eowyn]|uniref:Thymidine kinase n=1 Tax=Klebsiella phage vB_KvM-Eowyn TaxID=2762819 RepID=A0A7R8R5S6_9CAUD|nr:thymidine kinase [Klebsiella phage vB_KvM-Eowyn]CAD5236026.1 thymidine kinase [Klebsiella phage vB_KvM-Eowyn]
MGSLYFYYGSMNSSKTAQLAMAAHNYEEAGMRPLCFKPKLDNRDGDTPMIVSRIGLKREALWFTPEDNLAHNYRAYCNHTGHHHHCILVDEAQFLTVKQVKQLASLTNQFGDLSILCYGLRTDFQGKLFPGSAELLAQAEHIGEIKGMCVNGCGKKSTHVLRYDTNGVLVREGPQVQVGGNDVYRAVCRKCFAKAWGGN